MAVLGHTASVDGSRPAAANATQGVWVLLLRGSAWDGWLLFFIDVFKKCTERKKRISVSYM